MTDENINLEFLTQEEEDDNEDEQSQSILDAAAPEQGETSTVTLDGEEFNLVPAEQHEECTECKKLKQRVEELEEQNEQYETLIQEFRDERQSKLEEKIQSLNEDIPEDKQYTEEELEQKFEDGSISQLENMVDVMQRLTPELNSGTVESNEEDLTGTSQGSDREEQEQKLNQASQDLFGKPLDQVLNDKEQEHGD